jgi:hypothetical protein
MTAPAFQTAERRARGARAPLPRLRTVLAEQVRATGLALRGAALIGAALVALASLVIALQSASRGTVVDFYVWPPELPGLVGAVLPIAVWARDERFGPGFLWTLPVDRRRHVLTKVLAGWAWLMGGVALFALWLLALTLLTGGRVLPPDVLRLATFDAAAALGPIDPSLLRVGRWTYGPLIWVVPFTAATATYLLASALVLGSRYPLRWVIGAALSFTLAAMAGDAARARMGGGWLADAPARLLWQLVEGRYGLDALITARTETLSTPTTLTTGERVMVWWGVPSLAGWGTATLLWTGAGLLALWAAASRHGERRRP